MILILGAGLSGVLTAYRLQKEGIPFKIIEARDRVGGRINTVYGKTDTPIEMGATWFSDQHTNLRALLDELGIVYFEQYMEGTVFFERYANAPAEAIQIPKQPPSYRISGGTSNLINTLYQKLDAKDIFLNQTVEKIKFGSNSIQVVTDTVFEGDKLVLAMPPKLWANHIVFKPSLPENLLNVAKQTHTWMEDSMKVAVTYQNPFWQQAKQSGALFSNTGPITELYDHCNHERNAYALCGFINASFKHLDASERRTKVINQLKNVFGEKALDFIDYEECIWSNERFTSQTSETFLYPHQNNGNPIFRENYFDNRLLISSSEAASEFPGYMEGAVISSNTITRKIIKLLNY